MTASVSLSFCHDVDNSEHSYAAGLVPNTIGVVQLLTLPPRFLEQLCKKLLGLWRGGHPAALSPVSLRACQLGDAVYVYCSLSAQIASCLDILCSYIGVVRSVQVKASIACETSLAFPADLITIAVVKRFGRCRRSRVDPVLDFRLVHLICMQKQLAAAWSWCSASTPSC